MRSLSRKRNYDTSIHKPVNYAPSYQTRGIGEEQVTIEGHLRLGQTGGEDQLDRLAQMMENGEAHQLIKGNEVLGKYLLVTINEVHDYINHKGQSRKIDFTLTFKRQA